MVEFELLVSRNNIYELPHKRGIYVLLSDDNIPIYVGQSINVKHRVLSHFTGGGYSSLADNIERVYAVGIILCGELDNLDDVEQKYISLLKPILNIDKVDYIKDIDIQTLKKHGKLTYALCKFLDFKNTPCPKLSTHDGYCYYHDPNKITEPSWVMKGKLITSEMQRLLHEREYKGTPNYFYMSKYTFGKLLREKTYAEIDYINRETILKFKKHYIIIDSDDTIRLERYKLPASY